jgi:hypothetical protein
MKLPLTILIAALTFSSGAFARENDTLRLGIDPGCLALSASFKRPPL